MLPCSCDPDRQRQHKKQLLKADPVIIPDETANTLAEALPPPPEAGALLRDDERDDMDALLAVDEAKNIW